MNSKMRILATCQYGWPEPYPSLYPMEEMAKRGHYVHAITAVPNYPMGEIYDGYKKNKIAEDFHNGVQITHVPVVPRRKDVIHRFLNYHSYPLSACREIRKMDGGFDIVFANQSSPVMMVKPAIEYARKWDKKVVMYCMDLWPASLIAGGIKKDSLIYKFYYKVSKDIYKNVDVLLITSRKFKDYFIREFDIPENKIIYLPQYALSEFDEIPKCQKKDTTDFVFAGNIGVAQNLYVILRTALIFQKKKINDHGKQIRFHIVGDGQELSNLRAFAQKNRLDNVLFHGRKPLKEMPFYYSFADAMLITLIDDPLISLTLPAKVQTYMASAKPIIASANGEIRTVIADSNCGFCADANKDNDFMDAILNFLEYNDRNKLGENGKLYYQKNFSREIVMDKLERILLDNSVFS